MFDLHGNYVLNINKIKVKKDNIVGMKTGHNDYSLDVIVPGEKEQLRQRLAAIGGHAFTVTFVDSYLNKYRESYLKRMVDSKVKKTRGVVDSLFVAEYSKAGRFHLHGCVLVKDIRVISNVRRKMCKYGICKVKYIDDAQGWAAYCVKDIQDKVVDTPAVDPGGKIN